MNRVTRYECVVCKSRAGSGIVMLALVVATGCDRGKDPVSVEVAESMAASSFVPGMVSDLGVRARSGTSAELEFTEPQTGGSGPTTYDIRYTTRQPVTYGPATRVTDGTCSYPASGLGAGRTLTCTVNGLDAAQEYSFQLRARWPGSNRKVIVGPLSNIASTRDAPTTPPPTTPPPARVADLTAPSTTVSSVTIRFTTVDDGTGSPASYQVRYQSPTITWANATVVSSGTCSSPTHGTAIGQVVSCTVTGLSAGTDYQFQAVSYRGALNSDTVVFGGLSNIASATTLTVVEPPPPAPPARVSNLAAPSVTESSVTLRFTTVDDGLGRPALYQMRYQSPTITWANGTIVTNGTCSAPAQGTSIGQTVSCTVTGLTAATPYQFQVVSYRGALSSDTVVFGGLSNVASATTQEIVSPPPPPPGGDILFSSDFSTALGTSTTALSDGGRWTQLIGNGRANSVIGSAGLDFPTANVLDARAQRATSSGGSPTQLVRITSLPVIAVGEQRGFRVYMRVMTPDAFDATPGADSHTHPIQDGNAASDSNWMLQVFTEQGGAGQWRLRFANSVAPFTPPLLRKFVTYRIEWVIHRINTTQYNLHARVYAPPAGGWTPGSVGTLLYDDDDFAHAWGAGSLADAPAISFQNVNNTNGLNAGHNGVGSTVAADLFPFTLYYQSGIAVCSGWCGPR